MKKVLTHIALEVQDVAASADFYKKWCGMEVVHSRADGNEGQNVKWLASPGEEDVFVIVLLPKTGHENRLAADGIEHLGFGVGSREELRALEAQAREAGLLHWNYQEHPYPVGDLFSIQDPDGHEIEFSFGQPLGRDFKDRGPQP